jgi:hypothetical protein
LILAFAILSACGGVPESKYCKDKVPEKYADVIERIVRNLTVGGDVARKNARNIIIEDSGHRDGWLKILSEDNNCIIDIDVAVADFISVLDRTPECETEECKSRRLRHHFLLYPESEAKILEIYLANPELSIEEAIRQVTEAAAAAAAEKSEL